MSLLFFYPSGKVLFPGPKDTLYHFMYPWQRVPKISWKYKTKWQSITDIRVRKLCAWIPSTRAYKVQRCGYHRQIPKLSPVPSLPLFRSPFTQRFRFLLSTYYESRYVRSAVFHFSSYKSSQCLPAELHVLKVSYTLS